MASTLVLLLQLLLVSLASADYFGGAATFTYKGRNPDGTFRVDFRNKAGLKKCSFITWGCLRGDCGSETRTQNEIINKNPRPPQGFKQVCETETVSTRNVSSDKPFEMRSEGCCWATRDDAWSLMTAVDLGSRSDTGKPNRSPVIAFPSFLRVNQNCPRTYKLMPFDPDADKVRCRCGNIFKEECILCTQNAGFDLDEDSCLLHYRNSTVHPLANGFELVVEDFPRSNITLTYTDGSQSSKAPLTSESSSPSKTVKMSSIFALPLQPTVVTSTAPSSTPNAPLSKLPLQFSILVDPPAPSCKEGVFLPRFVHPTPENGARIDAESGKVLEIRVKAQATNATIRDVIMTGPLNISKNHTTEDEFVIRWTPLLDDVGDYYRICFVVEAFAGEEIYQSNMRCVLVNVWHVEVKANVICSETSMTVEVEKSSFPELHENQTDLLRLNGPRNTACSLQTHSNSTHIIAVVPLNSCGTQIEEDEENLIFKNEITADNNPEDLITREHRVAVQFSCQYARHGNVTQSFSAHRGNATVFERGFGTFTFKFELFDDKQFQSMIDPESYPLEYDLGSRIYMQIEATSLVSNTKLFVESCTAAPYDNPNYQPAYYIIYYGCEVDQTVEVYNISHERQFRFSVEAFKFIGLSEQVYITCSVLMCEAGNPDTRCAKGCTKSGSESGRHRYSGAFRRKRAAITQSLRHFISQGPLRLRRSAESTGNPVINLNLNLVFIAGCLLAAVGMISAAVMYKAKMSRVRYQPLPAYEVPKPTTVPIDGGVAPFLP